MKFATRAVHAGLQPDPRYRLGHPGDPPDLDLRAARGRRVRRGLRLRAQREPDALGAGALRSASWRAAAGLAFSSGMAARTRCSPRSARRGDHVVLPADLYGGTFRLVDKVLRASASPTRWSTRPTSTRLPPRSPPDQVGVDRDADQPLVERRRRAAVLDGLAPERGATSSRWTTPSRRRSTSGRWSSAPTPPCTRSPSTSAATPTRSAARSSCRPGRARAGALHPELGRRRARAV